ncbi:MAG: HK97 family phage prohead protease [Henriciella sp.]
MALQSWSKNRSVATLNKQEPMLVEGYASLFGVADASGDVVRAGAFARSLRVGPVPMLLQHKARAIVGRWSRIVEDSRGLFVRGLIESPAAQNLVRVSGVDGLSIGFRPRLWSSRRPYGRLLADIELVEISLVAEPMLKTARFVVV